MKISSLIAALALIVGCTSMPATNSEYIQKAEQSISSNDGTVSMAGRVFYFENTRGYTGVYGRLSNGDYQIQSIAITNRAVFFMQWNDKTNAFEIIKKIPNSSIKRTYIESGFVATSATIELDGHVFISFYFFNDPDKTRQAVSLINRFTS